MKDWIEIPLSVSDKLGEWALWAGARVLVGVPAILIYGWKQASRLSLHLAEGSERFYTRLLIPLDAIPYGGMAGSKIIEVEASPVSIQFCNDIIEALEGKHALLIGGSGDGKTTTAMFLAYSAGGAVRVYDADAAADEWHGLEVVGRGADFKAINQAMSDDLKEVHRRTLLRAEIGSHACNGMDTVTIAEEFPLLVGEVELASEWLIKHGKRGRRVKRFIIAIAQNDTVANFGIQGDAGVIDSFRVVRLGKKAQAHARKLKNPELENWLKADRSRLLVDDIPVQLPPYREIQRVIQARGLSSVPVLPPVARESKKNPEIAPETTENQVFQPPETGFPKTPEAPEIGLLSQILEAIHHGRSDDWIAKNVIMQSQSIGYYKAKSNVESIRQLVSESNG
jgi:hypothetical protein